MIEAIKYTAGTSRALDSILSNGDACRAWITNEDESTRIIIADTAEDAVRMYENLLTYAKVPAKKAVDGKRIRQKP